MHDEAVTPSREEALDAQVAALSGYVVDSVLLLSFGRHAAALAVHERRQLARQEAQQPPRGRRKAVRGARRGAAEMASLDPNDPVWRLPPDESITGAHDAQRLAAPPEVAMDKGDGGEGEDKTAADDDHDADEDDEDDTDEEDEDEDEEAAARAMQPLVPLSEWSAVESRCRRRLGWVQARLARLRQRRETEQQAFQLGDSIEQSGVLRRLAFLQGSSLELRWSERDEEYDAEQASERHGAEEPAAEASVWRTVPDDTLAAAEWNADLASDRRIVGALAKLPEAAAATSGLAAVAASAVDGAIYIVSEAETRGDFCDMAWRAATIGGAALLVACDTDTTRPMSFGSEQTAPPIPAAMVPASEAAPMLVSLAGNSQGTLHPRVSLLVRTVAIEEDEAGGGGGVDEGHMADVVALDDASEQSVHLRIVALEAEESRLEKALRFSSEQLRATTAPPTEDDNHATVCPICLERPDAVCVLPECFHCMCRLCLQRAVAGGTSFRCPLCRISVESWQVSVFRTETAANAHNADEPPPTIPIPPAVWRQQPSKLQRLLQLVHNVLCTAADERVLIYTQWLAHVEHIGAVLDAARLPSLRMSGDLGHCMRCLQRFGCAGQPRVLVLSSQHHSSGINLQAARNLIVVHPFCTPSATRPEFVSFASLRAFEQQAVGRIRRYPQTKAVRVWRLMSRDSVEEGLYRNGFVAKAEK